MTAGNVSATRLSDVAADLPPGVEPAPLVARLLAWMVDSVVPVGAGLAIVTVITWPEGPGRTAAVLGAFMGVLAWAAARWRMFAVDAAGPGMRLAKLQLVGFTDGRPIGWGRVLLRQLLLAFLALTGVGLVVVLIMLARDRSHRGWHDQATDSVVIGRPTGAPPIPRPSRVAAMPTTTTEPDEIGESVHVANESAIETRETVLVPSGWLAVLDDGREIPVDGLVVVGRNPVPREGEDARLVKVGAGARTVSKSHLALLERGDTVWVVDRDSTNGSTVTAPNGDSRQLGSGEQVAVEAGSVVGFGDHRLTIRRR